MTTLKVGIASYEDMKARTLAIARGELRPKPGDPKGLVHLARELCQAVLEPQPRPAGPDRRHATLHCCTS